MATPTVSAKELEETMRVFRDSEVVSEDPHPGFTVTRSQRPRRPFWLVPSILLITSLISMAWAGVVAWAPASVLMEAAEAHSLFEVRRHILANWIPGLQFALSLTAILGAHELGHYFVTRLYRVPSTLPLFIPFPVSPIGTCGAVIMMDGGQADKKQIFDIGIAGPLAGLVFAIPIAIVGLQYGTPPTTTLKTLEFGQPLAIQWIDMLVNGKDAARITAIDNTAMNPMLMAAWVGFLITGLNMIPLSQLDGGHVIFGLLGKHSRYVAWTAYACCAGYVLHSAYRYGQPDFIIMLLLIPLMGITHPPSSNDNVRLGVARSLLGWAALALPILCIPLRPIVLLI